MDDADITADRTAPILEADILAVREAAARIPVGHPGDCGMCGEWSGRLVKGVCAPCRDRYRLP